MTDINLRHPDSSTIDALDPIIGRASDDDVETVACASPQIAEVLWHFVERWRSDRPLAPAPTSALADRRREVRALVTSGRVDQAAALSKATLSIEVSTADREDAAGLSLRILHPVSIPSLAMTIYHYGGRYYAFPRTGNELGAIVIVGQVVQVLDSPPVRLVRALRRRGVLRRGRLYIRRLVRFVSAGHQKLQDFAVGVAGDLTTILKRDVAAPLRSIVRRSAVLSAVSGAAVLTTTAYGRTICHTVTTLFLGLARATNVSLHAWWGVVRLLLQHLLRAVLLVVGVLLVSPPEVGPSKYKPGWLARWIGVRRANPVLISPSIVDLLRLPRQEGVGLAPTPKRRSGPGCVA